MTLLPAIFCGALITGAVVTGYLEARPFLSRPQTPASSTGAARPAHGLSSYSKHYALNDCRAALESTAVRVRQETSLVPAAGECRALALDVLSSLPSDGLAHVVAARASAILGDDRLAAEHIVLSASVAPSELWLAQLRSRIVWEWKLETEPGVERSLRRDVGVIALRKEGRRWLAGWYVALPQSRASVTAGVATLSEDDQTAFVKAVQAASTR